MLLRLNDFVADKVRAGKSACKQRDDILTVTHQLTDKAKHKRASEGGGRCDAAVKITSGKCLEEPCRITAISRTEVPSPAANRIRDRLDLTEKTMAEDLWSQPGIGEGISAMILDYVAQCMCPVPLSVCLCGRASG